MSNNEKIDKLTILYLLDKIEVPLTEDTLNLICCQDNNWMTFLEFKNALHNLDEAGFVNMTRQKGVLLYAITVEGRYCIANFYTKIPMSKREKIIEIVEKDRVNYRKKQEFVADYTQNSDGTFTVKLTILDLSANNNTLEIKIGAGNKENAVYACETWNEKAAQIFETLYDLLYD